MKQIKTLLFIFLFTATSLGTSLLASEPFNTTNVTQNTIEIIDANETTDMKEEPSHIHISYFYQKFINLNNNYQNPFHISDANPFIPIKPPRKVFL